MTKEEFIGEVAARSGLSRRDAARAVDAFLDAITDTLKSGGEVSFTGFGKFTTHGRAERQGVNPRNPAERMTIPAATVPKFTAGAGLRKVVRGGSRKDFDVRRTQHDRRIRSEEPVAYDDEAPGVLNIDSEGEPDEPWRRPSGR